MITFSPGNTSAASPVSDIVSGLLGKRSELWFLDVDTTTNVSEIQNYVHTMSESIDTVVVLGIGGSALWTKALLEALYGKYHNEDTTKIQKRVYVLDNIDPYTFSDIENIIDLKKTLFICISKSGGTIETLSEYLYYKEIYQNTIPNWKKHFCFIVGENCSMKQELEKDFQVFYIPENIGGRFSVFTAVGMLPLAFAWADIQAFLTWISQIKSSCMSDNRDTNIALQLALTQYHSYRDGKNICVFFPYSSRLFQIGEWYKQLMGESIGKQRQGITLTSSLGATDQHSQLQLYQDGPIDKLFLMLGVVEQDDRDIHSSISGLWFKKLLDIEQLSTEASLKNEWIPVCSMSIEKIDEAHVAALLYVYMCSVGYLWELFQINAFDQPGVEKSKIITKQKLQEEFWDVDMYKTAFYD